MGFYLQDDMWEGASALSRSSISTARKRRSRGPRWPSSSHARSASLSRNRVADASATYIVETTVADFGRLHKVRIDHIYETFYMLILGIVGYMRQHPEASDDVLKDIIAQTLHFEREREQSHHTA